MKLDEAMKYFDGEGNIRVGRIEWGRDTIRPTPVDLQNIKAALEGCVVLLTMPLENSFGTAYVVSHPDLPAVLPLGMFVTYDVLLNRDEAGDVTRDKFVLTIRPPLEPGKSLEA